MKVFGGKLSSVQDRFEKWAQAVVVFVVMLLTVFGFLFSWFLLIYLMLFSSMLRIPAALYAGWIFYDKDVVEHGTRRIEAVRRWIGWKYFNNFFPTKLVKTADLPPDRNYLIAAFPHGILSTGAFCAITNHFGGFENEYPCLKPWILTLSQHFHMPFLREYVMAIGALPASASCLDRFLGGDETGHALTLMVGGAQESIYTEPGKYIVNLKRRKGFVKAALRSGASLVPAITFGEPDIYHQVRFDENSIAYRIQYQFKKWTGIFPVIFHGSFAFLPFRKPLHTVIGSPIEVQRTECPTSEEVEKVHAQFIEGLTNLFEQYKGKYLENSMDVHLIIM